MSREELNRRTKKFALDMVQLVEELPRGRTTDVIGNQLLRSATSVGANYRAACRAKSAAHFVSKLGDEEETDECLYWMELIRDGNKVSPESVAALIKEANEILSIVIAAIRTTRQSNK